MSQLDTRFQSDTGPVLTRESAVPASGAITALLNTYSS